MGKDCLKTAENWTVSNVVFIEKKPAFRRALLTNRESQLPVKRGRKKYF